MPAPGKKKPEWTAEVIVGCPVCGKVICYHCWRCMVDLSAESHKDGCKITERMPESIKCAACNGTGLNSRGGRCWPCEHRDMVEELRKPLVLKPIGDLFGD